jgi:thiamine-phosphate pyrophosphorylase
MVDWLRGYYAILDVAHDVRVDAATPGNAPDWAAIERRAARLLEARPACLQLRAKQAGAAAMRDIAAQLLPLCRRAGVPFCVNDRLDVALAVGADVVHLGQDDLPLADARRVAAGRLVIGFSTHDAAQARAAAGGGADYIGFGPVFATRTKENPDPVVGLAELRAVSAAVSVPVVAIGGITLDRVAAVAAAGAAAAAVISAVAEAPDPTAAGRAVAAAFGR